MEHLPKKTQRVGGCFLKFRKVHGTFLSQKSKDFLEKGGGGLFRENFDKYNGTFSYLIHGGSENFSKNEVGGVFRENFEKHHGTFVLSFENFC